MGPSARLLDRGAWPHRAPRRWTLWVAVAAALVVVVLGVLLWSPALVVERVRVNGVDGALADSVRTAASVPVGQPLARVDTEGAASRVEQDVRVAQATVRREWPSAVTVDVRLREAALLLHRGGSTYEVADADGVVFDTVDQPSPGVPVVRVLGGRSRSADLTGALAMVQALPEEVRRELADVRLAASGDLRFTVGAVAVRWGPGTEAALKAEVLQAFLRHDPIGDRLVTLDLSVPKTPVVTGLNSQS